MNKYTLILLAVLSFNVLGCNSPDAYKADANQLNQDQAKVEQENKDSYEVGYMKKAMSELFPDYNIIGVTCSSDSWSGYPCAARLEKKDNTKQVLQVKADCDSSGCNVKSTQVQ